MESTIHKLIDSGELFNLFTNPGSVKVSFFSQSLFPIYLIRDHEKRVIVKVIDSHELAEVESYSLNYLFQKRIKVPELFHLLKYQNQSYLFMEYIDTDRIQKKDLIETLIVLYQNKNSKFGFERNNYIGTLSQTNAYFEKFSEFFWTQRLYPLVSKAISNGLLDTDHLLKLEEIHFRCAENWGLDSHSPVLVHGDLWSGNVLGSKKGVYLIDPSLSYSIPEQDFAMSELFGGFPAGWIEEIAPLIGLESGYRERRDFWQIYPMLVHVNIFGRSYISGFQNRIMKY